jgi:hypothetical protein
MMNRAEITDLIFRTADYKKNLVEIDTLCLEEKHSDLRRNFPLMPSFGAFEEL